jgi:hypothetical protein
MEAFAEGELKGKVEIITPRKPWSAIARGAAIRALEKEPVLFRRARDNIGIVVHEEWNADKHEAKDYWRSPIFGERARNQMRWHVLRVSLHLCPWAFRSCSPRNRGRRSDHPPRRSLTAASASTRLGMTCRRPSSIRTCMLVQMMSHHSDCPGIVSLLHHS